VSAPPPVRARLGRIRLLAVDVDGVLTDGVLVYGPDGEQLKHFHVRDGLGLRLVREAGIEVAVVSARASPALARRLADLGLGHVHTGRPDKWAALGETMATLGVAADEVAFVGDDLLDVPVLGQVGVAIAPADAHPSARAAAHWITEAPGGRGAVREIADALLAARAPARAGFHVVIPARFGATRLPGKPLRPIAGRPMIAHVWDRAMASGAASVMVATDDDRIRVAVEAIGGRAVMTSPAHASGTDRIAEAAAAAGWPDDAIVVNLQGDEPMMPGAAVQAVAEALAATPAAGIATLATPIRDPASLFDPHVVKVVLDDAGLARWFSRAPMPWVRGAFDAGPPEQLPAGVPFLRHLGLYAYRVGTLRALAAAPVATHERAESLEQLRALARGVAIVVRVLDRAPSHGVDSEADLARIEHELAGRPTQ
jgi:3-deoxy-manno-octulosonate cytidylyltransferase (CMP-KDO synthetase)